MNFCFHRSVTDQAICSGNESVVWDSPLDPDLAASDGDSTNQVTIEDQEELLTFEPTLKLPVQLKELHVRVSHVNSPGSFYVQLTQNQSQLSRSADRTPLFELSEHLKSKKIVEYFALFLNSWTNDLLWRFFHLYYSLRVCELLKECAFVETLDGFVWRTDMYCAAEINGAWERGRICSELTPSNFTEVDRPLE